MLRNVHIDRCHHPEVAIDIMGISEKIVTDIVNDMNKAFVARYSKHNMTFTVHNTDMTSYHYSCQIKHAHRRHVWMRACARAAIVCMGLKLDKGNVCVIIHNHWLSHNLSYATSRQKQAYVLLSDYEKNKYEKIYTIAKYHFHQHASEVSYIS